MSTGLALRRAPGARELRVAGHKGTLLRRSSHEVMLILNIRENSIL